LLGEQWANQIGFGPEFWHENEHFGGFTNGELSHQARADTPFFYISRKQFFNSKHSSKGLLYACKFQLSSHGFHNPKKPKRA
jgi:hypothetical protein